MPGRAIRTRLTLWYSAILLGILVVIGSLSYSVLRWSLMQDLDASLMTVAQVAHDTRSDDADDSDLETEPCASSSGRNRTTGSSSSSTPRASRACGPPSRADPRCRSPSRRRPTRAAASGHSRPSRSDRDEVRLLTMPIVERRPRRPDRPGRDAARARAGALRRYLETLVILIPFGVGLAAAGGAVIARKALRPVDEMAAAARRITAEDLDQRISREGARTSWTGSPRRSTACSRGSTRRSGRAPLHRRRGARAPDAAHRAQGRHRGRAARDRARRRSTGRRSLEPRGGRSAHPPGRGPPPAVARGGGAGDAAGARRAGAARARRVRGRRAARARHGRARGLGAGDARHRAGRRRAPSAAPCSTWSRTR